LAWPMAVKELSAQNNRDGKSTITEKDFAMTMDEARRFVDESINPILVTCAENPNCEITSLQTRIRRLFLDITSGQLEYLIVPAYHPDRQNRSALKIELSNGPRPQLVLFAPEFRDLQKQLSAEHFRYEVLVTLAHEVIHLEQLKDFKIDTLDRIAIEEAAAWGKTILEIVRPLIAKGTPLPGGLLRLSDRLRDFRDDYRNPEWITLFRIAKPKGLRTFWRGN